MWYCLNCKTEFEEPDTVTDYVTSDPYPMGPTISVCPHCGYDEFVEAIECEYCGEYIVGEYIKIKDGICYCENCYEKHDNT